MGPAHCVKANGSVGWVGGGDALWTGSGLLQFGFSRKFDHLAADQRASIKKPPELPAVLAIDQID